MTKLKATLENLDGVDDAVKQFYTEKGDKLVLNIEAYDDHPEVQGLKKSLATARAEKKTVEAELGEVKDKYAGLPDDFTVVEYNKLKDSGSGDVDKRLQDQRERLAKEKDDAVAREKAETVKHKTRTEKLASENEISKALAEANITSPHMQKAVRAMFKDAVKVDYEGDDAIVTIDNLPVVDKIKAWAGTNEGKYFVAAPANGGGGGGQNQSAGNNKSDNPWTKEGFNLTKQAEIKAADPARAAQLKAAAGVK